MTTTAAAAAAELNIESSDYWMMMALSASACAETQALTRTHEEEDHKQDDKSHEELFQQALSAYEASKEAARDAKWVQHKFGLCCDCDAGLDDESDFSLVSVNVDILFRCIDCCRNPRFAYGNS